MPRSGTSLSAAIFSRKGYYVAAEEQIELRAPDEHNPFGYWEAKTLTRHNATILRNAGFAFDNTWLFPPIGADQVANIATLAPLQEHRDYVALFNKHAPWVWKDPRLCYTLGYWWPMMDPLRTSVMFLRRNPEEIYQSFLRLNWCGPSAKEKKDIFRRIHNHFDTAKRTIERQRIPHIEIGYEEYAKAPRQTAERIGDFFGVMLSEADLNIRSELNHSSLRGRIASHISKVANHLSIDSRRRIKAIIPKRIVDALFPEKNM